MASVAVGAGAYERTRSTAVPRRSARPVRWHQWLAAAAILAPGSGLVVHLTAADDADED